MRLPWPPSVNRYWRRNKNGSMRVSAEGVAFKAEVRRLVKAAPLKGPVSLSLVAVPPDRRRRDIDNILKALLDALEGVLYEDDSQIVHLEAFKAEPGDGYVEVEVKRWTT